MDGVSIAPWVAVTLIGVGQAITIWRFRSNTKKRATEEAIEETAEMTEMRSDVSNIKSELAHPQHGLSALKEDMSAMKLNCALVSTGLAGKVKEHERRLTSLNNKAPARSKRRS